MSAKANGKKVRIPVEPVYRSIARPIYGPMNSGVVFTPGALFASSETGVWFDPSDFATMFQDTAGTIPVTAIGQPVGKILDKRVMLQGAPTNGVAPSDARRPTLDGSGSIYWLQFDGADDRFFTTIGSLNLPIVSAFVAYNSAADGRSLIDCPHQFGAIVDPFSRYSILQAGGVMEYRVNGVPYVSSGVSLGANHVIELYTSEGDMVIDGLTVADNPGATNTYPNSTALSVGGDGTTDENFLGRMYGLIIVGRVLTADEKTSTRTWLAAKQA